MIVDASVALAWCFDDEAGGFAMRVLDRVRSEGARAPSIWPAEVSNALLVGVRRQRITATDVPRLIDGLRDLQIEIEPPEWPGSFQRIIAMASDLGLTVYDTLYLELAARLKEELATLDERLRHAAKKAAVSLISA